MAMVTKFKRLTREACKASIEIEGLTGKGKSGLALMIAFALAGGFKELAPNETPIDVWEKIFTTDAENRSLNLFVGIPASWGGYYGRPYGTQISADDGYAPSNYLACRDAAVKAGAEVWIGDSITHMWTAKGGVLDIVSDMKIKLGSKTDNYRVWGDPKVVDEKQKLIDVIRCDKCHVITTVRVKEKFDMKKNETSGNNEVVSMGEQQLQQEGLKYEPDLVLHMLQAGCGNADELRHPRAKVIKSRYAILSEGSEYEFTPALCEQLRVYLAEGVDPETLLTAQHNDYVVAIRTFLDANPNARAIWAVLKSDAGFNEVPLDSVPLKALKHLYTAIIA